MTSDEIISDIIRREGSAYTNRSLDRGGPTRWGITQETLTNWRGHIVSPQDVENLTESEAREIYLDRYIRKPNIGMLTDPQIQAFMVDAAVNHGPSGAIRMLQKELGVPQDGRLGPITLAAVNAIPPAALYRNLIADRAELYGSIISNDPSQAAFALGWMRRLGDFIRHMA